MDSPVTITVHKGDRVVLIVTNTDELPHGIRIPQLNLVTGTLRQDQQAKLEFGTTATGTFTMECSVPGCAPDHVQMLGQIVLSRIEAELLGRSVRAKPKR
jgi:heme/copper-type cytochrome/quinol oxidase subunit 2